MVTDRPGVDAFMGTEGWLVSLTTKGMLMSMGEPDQEWEEYIEGYSRERLASN